ncbi:MAG TPA: hypothetical protein VGR72_02360 [Candidatus Acidoferrales bacterium]|nr:hypothetical protein [Candidatus Acidoferrales bacterium]
MRKRAVVIQPRIRLIAMAFGAVGIMTAQIVPTAAITRALGQITARGDVAINGRPTISGGSIFSGDRVDAKSDSTAALSLFGGREIIQEGAGSIVVKEVEDGRITVVIAAGRVALLSPASAPVAIEARGVRIVPGDDGGVYEIQLVGQQLSVTARKGNAEIDAVNRTVNVGEGMRCDADLGASQAAKGERVSALGTPILKFTLISAALVSSAALAVILIEHNANCAVSPSTVGNCQVVH